MDALDIAAVLASQKTSEGRESVVLDGSLQAVLSSFGEITANRPPAVGDTSPDLQRLVLAVRVVRNSVPVGQAAVELIIKSNALRVICNALTVSANHSAARDAGSYGAVSAEGQTKPIHSPLASACAQLFANLATSGEAGAAAVWSNAWPLAILSLLMHPEASVHTPATLALYNCCRASRARSFALCGYIDMEPAPALTMHDSMAVSPLNAACHTCQEGQPSCIGMPGSTTDVPNPSSSSGDGATALGVANAAWTALFSHALGHTAPGTSSAPADPHGSASENEWLPLLVSLVAWRHGLLPQLMTCVAVDASSPGCTGWTSGSHDARHVPALSEEQQYQLQGDEAVAAGHKRAWVRWHWGRYSPTVLHVLAHEVQEMGPSGTSSSSSSGMGDADEPWQHALTCILHVVKASALQVSLLQTTTPEVEQQQQQQIAGLTVADTSSPRSACAAPVQAAAAAAGGTAGMAGRPAIGAAYQAASLASPPSSSSGPLELPSRVLEAGLEVLKVLAQRDDGGDAICGGIDPITWLARHCGLVELLVGLLACLRPIQAARAEMHQQKREEMKKKALERQRQQQQQGSGAPSSSGDGASSTSSSASASGAPAALADDKEAAAAAAAVDAAAEAAIASSAAVRTALGTACELWPALSPYRGYRGDILAVLANAAYRRPEVHERLEQVCGVELILNQCQLDEDSPLSREWGLWAVRNLCEGSDKVRARIASLELQTTVETPELAALGLRMELNPATGKMRVVKTDTAKALVEENAKAAQQHR